MTQIHLGLISGSSRPTGFNHQPALWALKLVQQRKDLVVTHFDVAELDLPFLDEPKTPMNKDYQHDYTRNWSEQISACDAFLVVTSEYNHSIPALLKNAFDYLNHEWRYKPVSFISYGSEAGGARAVEQWRQIAGELFMYDLKQQLLMPSYWERLDEKGNYQFSLKEEEILSKMLDDLAFWGQVFKQARNQMTK